MGGAGEQFHRTSLHLPLNFSMNLKFLLKIKSVKKYWNSMV